MKSRRLDTPPSLAGQYTCALCTRCRGAGCHLCNEGYTWISVYAQGRGEQGDDFSDLTDAVRGDEQMEAGHA